MVLLESSCMICSKRSILGWSILCCGFLYKTKYFSGDFPNLTKVVSFEPYFCSEKEFSELEKYLEKSIDGKFETEKVKISFRKSESLEIVDEDELNKWLEAHPECQKIEIKTTPIKAEIKKAMEQGEDVKGVVLKINNNVQVK